MIDRALYNDSMTQRRYDSKTNEKNTLLMNNV